MWIIFLEPIYVILWRGKSWVWVAGGRLSSPFALNIKPLVLRFALRVRSEEHKVRGKGRERGRYWHEEHQARCQVSNFKVLLRGCTAGTDKDNPKVSRQLWKEIQFDWERTFLTCWMNNLNDALMSRNVVYGTITWSCSLCCCPRAISLWRACPQMSVGGRDHSCLRRDLFLLTGLMLKMRTCCVWYLKMSLSYQDNCCNQLSAAQMNC